MSWWRSMKKSKEERNPHWLYLKYVVRHKWFVFVECVKLGIPIRGLLHDLSKFLPSEWSAYVSYFYGVPRLKQQDLPGMQLDNDPFDFAWLRHQHRNPHHWQWWLLREDDGDTKALRMPDRCVREMVADWRGAGKAQGFTGPNETMKWYSKSRHRIVLHSETRQRVHELLGVYDKAEPWSRLT